jgi:hypothetical protein
MLDARAGSYAEVRPARPGLLRVCAHGPRAGVGFDISAVRVLLVADLLTRTAELRGLTVLTVLALAGQSPTQAAALERDAEALGIHPPAARVSSDEAQAPLGGPFDVHVVSQAASFDGSRGGLFVSIGIARSCGAGIGDAAAEADLFAKSGHDPLAARLALMSFPSDEPADLTAEVLAGARETLGDWRHRVAEWAESPSKPMPARIAELAGAAFGDLNTASALALLRGLAAESGVPAGAKFETFVFADRILGLDLPREIGQPRA